MFNRTAVITKKENERYIDQSHIDQAVGAMKAKGLIAKKLTA
jgi:hypothetical protein